MVFHLLSLIRCFAISSKPSLTIRISVLWMIPFISILIPRYRSHHPFETFKYFQCWGISFLSMKTITSMSLPSWLLYFFRYFPNFDSAKLPKKIASAFFGISFRSRLIMVCNISLHLRQRILGV